MLQGFVLCTHDAIDDCQHRPTRAMRSPWGEVRHFCEGHSETAARDGWCDVSGLVSGEGLLSRVRDAGAILEAIGY